MKTIEKANKTAVHAENFEDIIFEGRNQSYGAYSLRKNYNNHLFLSFLVVVIIANLIAGIPFLHSLMNPPVIKNDPTSINVHTTPTYVSLEQFLPPPPSRVVHTTAIQTTSTNSQPVVVEEVQGEEQMDPTDILKDEIGNIEIPTLINTEPVVSVSNPVDNANKIYTHDQVTTQAMFKDGSVDNFRKWLAKNMYYPLEALDNGIKGTIVIKFAIDKFGKICDIIIVRGLDPAIDQAAIKTLKSSPKWTAATIEGKPVKVSYSLPIAFNIQR